MHNPADVARSIEISGKAACTFLEIKAWAMPINSPKAPEDKAYSRVYLKKTALPGFITPLTLIVSKGANLTLYSAVIVQKVKNIARVF